MKFKAPNDHHLLLLLLVLACLPFTMANWIGSGDAGPAEEHRQRPVPFAPLGTAPTSPHQDLPTKDDSYSDIEVTYGFRAPAPADARDEDQTNKEPEAYKQLKNNLSPVIRQRLTELLKKALTVESAIEAA
ncbi:hypothetical protein RHGRI_038967 [Rhododendron griersonianum]|uniref:Uncharacterized protein n=1 Tax=Rhododendron griersonianum TaxID=479676 RepID=A0AAV6HIA7_9ERIC|nr:hypothetical protein RHGRI_038967 [Rhododendron griersonianum]